MLSPHVHRSPVVLALLLLSACGGGGGGGSGGGTPPPPPPPPPAGSLQFSTTSLSVDEDVGTVTLTITRTGGSAGAVGVTVMSDTGTATAGADYAVISTTVTFADGDTAAKTLPVQITNDTLSEVDETLNLTLSAPTGGAILGAGTTASVTIHDNDPVGSLQFSATSLSVDEDGGTATLTITRTGGSAGLVGVTVKSSDGTATAATDYTAVNKTVTFAADDTAAKTVTVQITNDSLSEVDETLSLTLSAPTGGATLGANTTATLTIRDDEPPAGTLQFSVTSLTVDEGDGTANLAVTRTAGSAGAISVTVKSSNGTATAGQDYTAVDTTVTFGNGDVAPKLVTVPLTNDAAGDTNETFALTLSAPTGGASLGANAVATVTINDTDPSGTVQFQSDIATLDEDSGAATLTVTLARLPGSTSPVSVKVASANGSAVAGQDYTALDTTVTFDVGDSDPKTVTVPITNDSLAEDDETLSVKMSAPTGGAILGATTTTMITISDDDPPSAPDVTISANFKQFVFDWTGVATATHYVLFQDRNDGAGFTQVGPTHAPNETHATVDVPGLHLIDWVKGHFRLDACNAQGCGSKTISAADVVADAIGYFKASNTEQIDQFGGAVALSADGSTLAVGARGEDSNAQTVEGDQNNNDAQAAGAVYVFTHSATGWEQQAYIKGSRVRAGESFGSAIALSEHGDTLAVGVLLDGGGGTGVNPPPAPGASLQSGAVYVFTRDAGAWSEQAYLKASNATNGDEFGRSVALNADGTTLAVGANGEDSDLKGVNPAGPDNFGADSSGAAYVFTLGAAGWEQQAFIKASNTGSGDVLGLAVSLSADGNTLVVGAGGEGSNGSGEDNNDAVASGAAYVFERDGAQQWSQQAYLKASNPRIGNVFGISLALSADGSTIAVGASDEDSDAKGIDGDQLNINAVDSGAAYVFARTATGWMQQAYVKASNTERVDLFGTKVALSADGNVLAVSAPRESSKATGIGGSQTNNDASSAGAVYVLTRDGTQWTQRTYVKASNTQFDDHFGNSLSLSGDGTVLVVGAPFEASAATGVDGSQSDNSAMLAGAVYMY